MSDWHYNNLLQELYITGKFAVPFIVIIVLALICSIIYFIDGIKKYGYWLQKDDKKKK